MTRCGRLLFGQYHVDNISAERRPEESGSSLMDACLVCVRRHRAEFHVLLWILPSPVVSAAGRLLQWRRMLATLLHLYTPLLIIP